MDKSLLSQSLDRPTLTSKILVRHHLTTKPPDTPSFTSVTSETSQLIFIVLTYSLLTFSESTNILNDLSLIKDQNKTLHAETESIKLLMNEQTYILKKNINDIINNAIKKNVKLFEF